MILITNSKLNGSLLQAKKKCDIDKNQEISMWQPCKWFFLWKFK